ncbi:MAG: zinc-dependent metalloprotease, partial [Gemmatimonadales bacterium]|nr:zinc-dependent metalloprotease [Gemmatimonadales bacterium]
AGVLARALLAARGDVPAGAAAPKDFIGQAIKALVMHEIGHTLGLRHNFRGSAGATADELRDRSYTAREGMGVSVMDYSPPSIARDARRQGDYFAPTIGSYDRWAIRYGYTASGALGGDAAEPRPAPGGTGAHVSWTPEVEGNALRAIASEASDPAHVYGTDEDAGFGGAGVDPSVSRYDQTDKPLEWARERVALINSLFDSLDTRMVAPGQSYARLRAAFTDLLTDRWYAMLVTTKYLGGATTSRDHRGDPSARPPLVTLPAAEQREALTFLVEQAFGESAYRFSPDLLSNLAPDRWTHWGSGSDGRIDFAVHDWAQAQQGALLGQLLDPAVLERIRDAELRVRAGDDGFTLPELFATLDGGLWSELGTKPGTAQNIGSIRRDIQRQYLNRLISFVVSPAVGTPEDAQTLARLSMTELAGRLDRALARPATDFDTYTRAHLVDSRERITQALTAPMLQTLSNTR